MFVSHAKCALICDKVKVTSIRIATATEGKLKQNHELIESIKSNFNHLE